MGYLYVIFDEGGGGESVPLNSEFFINIELKKIPIFVSSSIFDDSGQELSSTVSRFNNIVFTNKRIVFRTGSSTINSTSPHKIIFIRVDGNFNYDNISVDPWVRRVEVRNEYGVLIADNGVPWGDGTYPPDAKNRAGLVGLHAAPAVINPELETALMGDATNEERVQE